jgi:hypothetical protein
MMCIVGIWVYYDPIAQQAGLSSHISGMAVYISLAFQVLGGTLATLTAGRLKWFPVFVICAAVDFGMIALLGASLGPTLAGMIISPGDTRGALWFGAGCLFFKLRDRYGIAIRKEIALGAGTV